MFQVLERLFFGSKTMHQFASGAKRENKSQKSSVIHKISGIVSWNCLHVLIHAFTNALNKEPALHLNRKSEKIDLEQQIIP